ncbi:serine hydrolase domain-containing protein [Aquipuribacter sp. MA13-6]|uniref:serine hydrolase domain-containing protein n=1 Tax=unclassified Aquipuribacter TaxID=2635084 RepID=UPI003EEAA0DE
MAEGLVGLDDTVLSYFPELDADVTDPRSRSLTLRHLGSMSAGHLTEALEPALALDPEDLVRGFLRLPPEREPGTHFAYSQPCTYTLAAVLQRVTGQRLSDHLRPRLLDPLGIGPVAWQQDPPGRDIGYSGLHAGVDAIANLAQLYLQRGRWAGEQLLPESWVEEASRVQVGTPDEEDPDWRLGYGLQLWRSRHGYRADGAYGQLGLVLPDQDAVVALTSECDSVQPLLEAVWTHLLPALSDGAQVSTDADEVLLRRLAGLRLPAVEGAVAPADPDAWDGVELRAGSGSSTQAPAPTSVLVSRAGERWEVVLRHGDQRLTMVVGGVGWSRDEAPVVDDDGREVTRVPMATSVGWTPDGTLAVDVALLQTPHTLRLRGSSETAQVDVRWVTPPLWAPRLSDLAAPWDPAPGPGLSRA